MFDNLFMFRGNFIERNYTVFLNVMFIRLFIKFVSSNDYMYVGMYYIVFKHRKLERFTVGYRYRLVMMGSQRLGLLLLGVFSNYYLIDLAFDNNPSIITSNYKRTI